VEVELISCKAQPEIASNYSDCDQYINEEKLDGDKDEDEKEEEEEKQ